jgi:hypothetical protein
MPISVHIPSKDPRPVSRIQAYIAKSGNILLASGASRVYCVVTIECRWVETRIPAPSLGTRGGRSQWCNRLPEVAMTSVAIFP